MTPQHKYLFDLLDGWVNEETPFGIARPGSAQLQNLAFDYYIATYGVPTTANDARRMFEWASVLDMAALVLAVGENDGAN